MVCCPGILLVYNTLKVAMIDQPFWIQWSLSRWAWKSSVTTAKAASWTVGLTMQSHQPKAKPGYPHHYWARSSASIEVASLRIDTIASPLWKVLGMDTKFGGPLGANDWERLCARFNTFTWWYTVHYVSSLSQRSHCGEVSFFHLWRSELVTIPPVRCITIVLVDHHEMSWECDWPRRSLTSTTCEVGSLGKLFSCKAS